MSNLFADQTMDLIERTPTNSTLETVQALCILSFWEWASSSNLAKSRARSVQAIQIAMNLGIHQMDPNSSNANMSEGQDWRKDMARRTWWVLYVNQLTTALLDGTSPVVGPDDPHVHVHLPTCSLDDESWPNWVNSVRQCSRVLAMVNAVYHSEYADVSLEGEFAEKTSDTKAEMRRQVVVFDRQIIDLMKHAERMAIIDFVPGGEEEVVRNQQTAARLIIASTHIYIHRIQAFPEVSLFSKQICGLPRSPDLSREGSDSSVFPVLRDGQHESPVSENAYKATDGNRYGSEAPSNRVNFDFVGEMWQPDTYPENLPAPWFTHAGGAASFWAPTDSPPEHYPPMTASILPITPPISERQASDSSITQDKRHKAWGVDDNDKPASSVGDSDDLAIFPPGISLARCATAAHAIVRLEVLHRSAVIAMTEGP